ncbi:transposase [Bradyrhizobium sp. BRP22]|uniref:transposase n=1 Tax=Bradyrhizobium sp. BRP22 TaxID=2793821 RepID=UPI001CD5AA76|nr:transposase [Bradyrhizobium sp. BRP22]
MHKSGTTWCPSIPLVCQDWANTEAAYCFFSNEWVNEADILCGHRGDARARNGDGGTDPRPP